MTDVIAAWSAGQEENVSCAEISRLKEGICQEHRKGLGFSMLFSVIKFTAENGVVLTNFFDLTQLIG